MAAKKNKKDKRDKPKVKATKALAREPRAANVKLVDELRAELGEASAVVALDEKRFLVACDADGIKLVERDGSDKKRARVRVLHDVDGIEGLCRVGDRVLAVREQDSSVRALTVSDLEGDIEKLGELERPPASKEKKNKGWEGIAHLPAKLSFDGKDHVVAVHEGKPRAVGVFAWPSLAAEGYAVVDDGPLDKLLPDLADVAVHPRSGELWIVSDEAERVVRVELGGAGGPLTLVGVVDLPVEDDEKPEGIDFGPDGALWIVTDESGRLLRLSVSEDGDEE